MDCAQNRMSNIDNNR